MKWKWNEEKFCRRGEDKDKETRRRGEFCRSEDLISYKTKFQHLFCRREDEERLEKSQVQVE